MKIFILFLLPAILIGFLVTSAGLFLNTKCFGQALPEPTEVETFPTSFIPKNIDLVTLTNSIRKDILSKIETKQRAEERRLAISQTNFNNTLVDILSGVKVDAKRFSGISQPSIVKSINYVFDKKPELITNYLGWKYHEAFVSLFQWWLIATSLVFICRFCRKKIKYAQDIDDGLIILCNIITWVTLIFSFLCLALGGISNVQDMLKIKKNPQIYLVDYVTDLVKENAEK